MILNMSAATFGLLMFCSFCAGLLGAAVFTVILYLISKKKRSDTHSGIKRIARDQAASGWQRNAQDEQLYNGR